MKNKAAWLSTWLIMGSISVFAQEKKSLNIHEVIDMATTQSKEALATDTKVLGRKLELQQAKSNVLPDAKVSGQYMMLSTPDLNIKIPMKGDAAPPDISTHQLMLGQANVSMPLYAGGKIRHGIQLADHAVQAEEFNALNTKEQLASQAIKLYVALYKAQQMVLLMEENIKRSNQQVADFKAMEANGLLARNDLLKGELQLSNYKVALQEANKNVNVVNYQLVNLLQLPEDTRINQIQFNSNGEQSLLSDYDTALEHRNDLKVLESQHQIAVDQVNISKAGYLPQIALSGGYTAFGLKDVITVKNAMNVGVGLSYDLGSLYKNKRNVNVAKNRVIEVEEQQAIMNDRVKVQVQQANENYSLAQEQQKVYEQAVEQANENYRIVKDKYDNGVADTDDLLEADVQQLQSKINQAISKANTIEKQYDVLLANGQLITK